MLIVPFSSAWHGRFVQAAARGCMLDWDVRCDTTAELVSEGLALVNNDACYGALVAAAQAVQGVRNAADGGAAPDGICVGLPMLCNRCRSIDEPFFVEGALSRCGYAGTKAVPLAGLLAGPDGIPADAQRRVAASVVAADVLLQARLQADAQASGVERPGLVEALDGLGEEALRDLASREGFDFGRFLSRLDEAASRLAAAGAAGGPVVGIAGSAASVYNEGMNGDMAAVLRYEGCVVRLPYLASMTSFALRLQGVDAPFVEGLDVWCRAAGEACPRIPPAPDVDAIREKGRRYVPDQASRGLGCYIAGWATALLDEGVENVVVSGLFGCLTGHVSGAGILGAIRRDYPDANMAAVEFDSGTSVLNQVNRLKLFASVAWQKKKGAGT